MIGSFKSRQFLVFVFTGGTAAAVNFFSRMLFSLWVDFSVAIVLAYLCGMVTAYLLARAFVFKDSQQHMAKSIGFFVLVNLVAILQTWGISVLLLRYLHPFIADIHLAEAVAHAVGVVVPVFTSYLGHKHFTFKSY